MPVTSSGSLRVQLAFDTALEQRIEALRRTARAGVGGRATLALGLLEGHATTAAVAALARLARRISPTALTFDVAVSLPTGWTLVARPDRALSAARRAFVVWRAELGASPAEPWQAACPLTDALPDCSPAPLDGPLCGHVERLELVVCATDEVVASLPLGGEPLAYQIVVGALGGHADAVAALDARVFELREPRIVDMLRSELDKKTGLMSVLCTAGEALVGYKVGYHRGPGQFHSWLGGVDPEHRRRGIATQLMALQHGWCRDHAYDVVRTVTVQRFAAMFRLNLAAGFEIVGMQSSRNGLKLILERTLANADPAAGA